MNAGSVNQDKQIKSIQKQIENVRKQLQRLSDNKDMSPKDMMEKRKELQQQIQDLNKQIAQRKIEIQKEKSEEAVSKTNDKITNDTKDNGVGMTTDETGIIISFSTTKEQMTGMIKIKTDLEGKLRTARSGEEKTELQAKVDNITNALFEKAKEIGDTISEHQEDAIDEVRSKQTDSIKEDKTDIEENKASSLDVPEQKISSNEKPAIYTRTGEANQPESEVKLSVVV
ncbi:FlxA-like family protein [Clostridium sp. D2Q-14]|uniref:FlxA-like family protein n=1 Tax=Anaeromonas gelatinilytica TaxID=2683194 RepID=UPI00193BC2F1|nr:FlxA-like family protein [Anaeromonas gelatinilytica]MBS4535961.1 FlxA-like family protein [Anaeromonas gelatinilytica]